MDLESEKIKGEEYGNILKELGFYTTNKIDNVKCSTFCNGWKLKDALGEEHWVVDLINTELTENSLQEEEYYDVCSPKVYKFKIITDDTGVHIKDDLENNELVYNVPNNTTEFRTLLNNVILLFKQVKIESSKLNLEKDFEK